MSCGKKYPKEITSSEKREVSDYVKGRVEYKVNLYSCKADVQKWSFWITSTASMVFAAAVPVVINLDKITWSNNLATILSLLVTILVGYQGIFRPREHWRNYDLISASLRREEMLFSTSSGEYSLIDTDTKRFKLFVNRVESLIMKEREETIIMRTSELDNAGETKSART